MRSRLLDMGQVGPVRAYSVPHAVTAGLGPESEPVLILANPASSVVSLDQTADVATEIDLASCTERRIPVIRRWGGLGANLVGPSHLLLAFGFSRSRARELGLPEDAEDLVKRYCQAISSAVRGLGGRADSIPSGGVGIDGREVAHIDLLTFDDGFCCLAGLAVETSDDLHDSVLRRPLSEPSTALRREIDPSPDANTVAEAAVGALEKQFGLELVPSMPQPHELEAIYEWDLRLRLEEGAGIEEQTPAGVAQ